MTYDELIAHFGTAKKALQAVCLKQGRGTVWKEHGIPIHYQCLFEIMTKKKLVADREWIKNVATRGTSITGGSVSVDSGQDKQ